MGMNAIVLCAGYGNRLKPLTDTCPKCLVEVAGKSVLEWIFDRLEAAEIRHVAVNILRSFAALSLPTSKSPSIQFWTEPWPQGTAASVSTMMGDLSQAVVCYGDILWDWNLQDMLTFHEDVDGDDHVTVALHRSTEPWHCGVATLGEEHRIIHFVEKPEPRNCESQWVNAGVMVIPKSATYLIPKAIQQPDIARNWLPALIRSEYPVYGYLLPQSATVIDIGTPKSLAYARDVWASVQRPSSL
jgi:NDP-sugar pyrophosphorylase family protein